MHMHMCDNSMRHVCVRAGAAARPRAWRGRGGESSLLTVTEILGYRIDWCSYMSHVFHTP